MALTLFLGPKNYSSWSLRPWLVCKHVGLQVIEEVYPVNGAGAAAGPNPKLRELSPSGLVPCLRTASGQAVWDSLAIIEYVAEQPNLARPVWPAAADARAFARCISAEMHSGFADVRGFMPMNVKYQLKAAPEFPPKV